MGGWVVVSAENKANSALLELGNDIRVKWSQPNISPNIIESKFKS